jgi:pimeloyl-ACP methyl ester carboxylesterase
VDGSVVLDCPEISEAVREARVLLSDEALDCYTAAGASCAGRLQAEGVDLAGYTFVETIDDNEDARVALGYDRISLLGESYGTRLAMIYEWMYPDSLHRVVMLAVNPPGHFVWDAEVIDEQIEDYARLCAQDAECSARTDDLAASMRRVSADMPNCRLLFPIDEGVTKALTHVMFYESIQPPGMPLPLSGPAAVDLWLAADRGDASGMALVSMTKNMILPNVWTWGHFLSMGVSSGDYLDVTDDHESILYPPDSLIGAPVTRFLYGPITGWPAHTIDEEYFEVQASEIETLLVSGSIDFATPAQWATEELLPHLTNGEQVILEDIGHTESVWYSQPEARAHLITTFFDTGEVDASLYEYQPIDFTVDRGWSDLMRIFIIIVSIVIALIIALIWLTIYVVRRRRARNS